MRYVAAVPAVGLLAGAGAGLLVPAPPVVVAVALLICSAASSGWAWRVGCGRALAAFVAAGFFVGGALLSADAWQHAWRPSLRTAFENIATIQRAETEAEGRRVPEDAEAFATVEGVLRADAAPTTGGVSLSVAVDGLDGHEGQDERQGQAVGPRPSRPYRQVTGGIAVSVVGALAADLSAEWRAGRRVRFPVTLRRPPRYLDPGVPDQERALARRGTTLVGTVKSGALIRVVARAGWFDEAMSASRAFSRRALADGVGRWDARSGAIVAAIVIGDRAGLDNEVQRRLQEAGTYHVIAISGGNIAIVAGLLLAGFRRAGWLGRTAMVSSIAALLAYAAFVGNGASVDRATLMAVVYFGARAIDQRSPPLNALALVAATLVATDPLIVADPAFLLTFGATLAILLVVPAITMLAQGPTQGEPAARQRAHVERAGGHEADVERAGGRGAHVERESGHEAHAERVTEVSQVAGGDRHSRVEGPNGHHARGERVGPGVWAPTVVVRRYLLPMFAASVAAEAMLFPIGALTFSRVTFAGLALNFLAIPLMGIAQIAGMAVVPMALVSPAAAAAAGWIAHAGAAGLVWSADLVRFAPALTYRVAPPAWTAVSLYYCAGAAWWTAARSAIPAARASRRIAAAVTAAAGLWILVNPYTLLAARGDGRLHVTFLDVGQGDSAFVVFPGGSTMVVDAGGLSASSSFDIGDRVVAPVVRDAGFRRIDYLALTHGDPDHIGGASSIVREFRPREVWEGIPVPRDEPLTALRIAAQASGGRWANVYRGDHVMVDGVDVIARHPLPADWERQRVRNDDSLVLELRWRDVSVLLTGDIGKAVERDIATGIPPARLRVIKIPHHGSLTSSTPAFLGALHPAIAVASAGRANHFGHPVPEVLDRYRAVGAEIFRTDQDGAVMVSTDGASIDVRTFTGRRWSLH